jgi:hypothetical protein
VVAAVALALSAAAPSAGAAAGLESTFQDDTLLKSNSQASPPNVEASPDPDYASLAVLGRLERALDRAQRPYGSRGGMPLYLTEYGYITRPPKRDFYLPQATAAAYLNWAEYLAWRDPRVQTLTQYLLRDPPPVGTYAYGGFASGLEGYDGTPKPGYDAYRVPLYMPVTAASAGTPLEIWGCARPVKFYGVAPVQIQLRPDSGGGFQTVATATPTDARGYFDSHVTLASGGTLRLAWTYPGGTTVYSRTLALTLR